MERILPKLLIGVAIAALLLALFAGIRACQRIGIHQGYEPDQPIAYSHKVHAGDNKIPCLYCHFGAETSRHAGIPPTNVCMNCHSVIKKNSPEVKKLYEALKANKPIEWVKVHNLPDFVYFNHSQHVSANVACQDCHGLVERMTRLRQEKTLTMGWCLSCHRERGLESGLDCAKCHQ